MLDPNLLSLLERFGLDRTYRRGLGSWLEDEAGRRVLDLTSQYGAVPFGHNPPALWSALDAVRASSIPALVQPSRPVLAEQLAERLARIAPVEGSPDAIVTFAQSGTEVVEIALRLARASTGRSLLVGARGGFHGRTPGAAALAGQGTELPGYLQVPFDDLGAIDALFAERGGDVAAVVLEPLQGEGGVIEPTPGYLTAVREACTRHGALLVLDEIQTGLGRTGARFAADDEGVRADIVVVSKALGGGLVPLAACIADRRRVPETFWRQAGSTFANNNLTSAVGLAVLDALDGTSDVVRRVRERGERLRAELGAIVARYPHALHAVRGRGYLLGLELEAVDADRSYFVKSLDERGALALLATSYLLNVHGVRVIPCLGHGRVLRIEPSLDVSDEDLALGLEAVEDLARMLEQGDYAALVRPVLGTSARTAGHVRPERSVALEVAAVRPIQASRPVEPDERPGRFAFLLHPTCPEDYVRTTPAFASLDAEELRALYRWFAAMPGHAPVCFMPSIRGRAGSVAQGWLIALSDNPESMIARPREHASAAVRAAVETAKQLGADVVGLGAFTSIVTSNGADLADCPLAITTGSALTVATAVDGVLIACDRTGLDPASSRVVVVGIGAVGGAAASLLAERFGTVVLVGNPARRAESVQKARAVTERIARAAADAGRHVDVELGFDLAHALADADVVVTATSAARPIVVPAALRPGALVCDVAQPPDVAHEGRASLPDVSPEGRASLPDVSPEGRASLQGVVREDHAGGVLVFDGGLCRYPEPIAFGQNLGYEPGVNLACLTETVLLALEGVRAGRFGVERDRLVDDVAHMRTLAARHGFSVAALRRGTRLLADEDFDRVARARLRRTTAGPGRSHTTRMHGVRAMQGADDHGRRRVPLRPVQHRSMAAPRPRRSP